MAATLFWIAAGLSALTFCVHVVAGGLRVTRPLIESDLPEQLKAFLYLGWHSASVAIAAIGAGFAASALEPNQTAYALVATTLAACLVLIAIWTALKLNRPIARFPVIPLFGLVTAIGATGLAI